LQHRLFTLKNIAKIHNSQILLRRTKQKNQLFVVFFTVQNQPSVTSQSTQKKVLTADLF